MTLDSLLVVGALWEVAIWALWLVIPDAGRIPTYRVCGIGIGNTTGVHPFPAQCHFGIFWTLQYATILGVMVFVGWNWTRYKKVLLDG